MRACSVALVALCSLIALALAASSVSAASFPSGGLGTVTRDASPSGPHLYRRGGAQEGRTGTHGPDDKGKAPRIAPTSPASSEDSMTSWEKKLAKQAEEDRAKRRAAATQAAGPDAHAKGSANHPAEAHLASSASSRPPPSGAATGTSTAAATAVTSRKRSRKQKDRKPEVDKSQKTGADLTNRELGWRNKRQQQSDRATEFDLARLRPIHPSVPAARLSAMREAAVNRVRAGYVSWPRSRNYKNAPPIWDPLPESEPTPSVRPWTGPPLSPVRQNPYTKSRRARNEAVKAAKLSSSGASGSAGNTGS